MEVLDLNWLRLILDGPGLAWVIVLVAALFLGIPLVVGAVFAVVASLLELSPPKGFLIGMALTLVLLALSFADHWPV